MKLRHHLTEPGWHIMDTDGIVGVEDILAFLTLMKL